MSGDTEDVEIEQMIRSLCETANHFTISTHNGGVSVYAAWMGSEVDGIPTRIGDGPTLREALAAACAYMKRSRSCLQ